MFDIAPKRITTNDPKIEQCCQLYEKFVRGTKWLNDRAAQGVDTYQDRIAFFRGVVVPMDDIWAKLPPDLRKEAAYRLVDKGILPDVLAKALEVFEGEVVALK